MAKASRALYRAAAAGRLAGHLAARPEEVTREVAAALEADFSRAVEFGDLGAAQLSGQAAAAIHYALGNERASAERYLDLVELTRGNAQTTEDVQVLRDLALAAGARADDAGLAEQVVECRLVAAEADLALVGMTRTGAYAPAVHLTHLLDALRGITDLAEEFTARSGSDRAPGRNGAPVVLAGSREHLQRFTEVLATVTDLAIDADWPTRDLLPVRSLLRRASRAGEWVVRHGGVSKVTFDPKGVQELRTRLVRLFTEVG